GFPYNRPTFPYNRTTFPDMRHCVQGTSGPSPLGSTTVAHRRAVSPYNYRVIDPPPMIGRDRGHLEGDIRKNFCVTLPAVYDTRTPRGDWDTAQFPRAENALRYAPLLRADGAAAPLLGKEGQGEVPEPPRRCAP